MMKSRERILAAIEGRPVDHVPLTTWCFGFPAPPQLRWRRDGREVAYWYSMRIEHLHTLPQPWTLEDDCARVRAWQSLGVDDALDVSIPWSIDPAVTSTDSVAPAGQLDPYPVLVRQYQTPSGPLRHAVRQTGEDPGAGWVIQPECVPLFEDYNIPRAVEHAVASPDDVEPIRHLYAPPDSAVRTWLDDRMRRIKPFADEHGVFVQAWSAFGMDAAVWLCGTEGAIMMALDHPEAFGRLVEIIAETDRARTEMAASQPGIGMVVQRGWYSSTDFWSPALFEQFVYPHLARLVETAHRHGKKFGYVMTTGVEILGPRLADLGVDVLFFVDPVQDRIGLQRARELLGGRITLVGGTNALSLAADPQRIRDEVKVAIDTLTPTKRFILHPVDAIFPDTPWSGVETLIEAWKEHRER